MGGFLSGLIGGYGETMLGIQERQQREEMQRRQSRLEILKAAIPNIQDPDLQAEAFGLMEEIATGKGRGKKGGIASVFGGLIGRGPEDIGQGERVQEFMRRPRETEVRPPITMPAVELPPIPGQITGTRISDEWMAPGVTGTVRGPLATPEELLAMRGAELRSEAKIKQQIEQENRQSLETEAKRIGLTDPRDIANYVNTRALTSDYATGRVVNVAGTVPGSWLRTQPGFESADENQQYHITRDGVGKIVSAYPASVRLAEGDIFPDATSTTGYSRRMYDPITGQEAAPQKNVPPPAAWAPTTTVTHGYRQVVQADGSIVLVPVTTTSTRERTLPGGAPAALPPVPGPAAVGTQLQPGQVVGAQPGVEPVVRTADGRTVVGHKALTVADRRDIGSVTLSLRLAGQLKQVLDTADPQTGQKLRDRVGTMQQLQDAMGARWGAFRYGTLGITSGSDFLRNTMALTNLARVIFASPYLKGVRAYQWVHDIQRHIPDASTQGPAAMAERLDQLVPILESMWRDLRNELGLTHEQMATFMGEAEGSALPEVPGGQPGAAAPALPATPAAKPAIPPRPKW